MPKLRKPLFFETIRLMAEMDKTISPLGSVLRDNLKVYPCLI
jgi:hypothetical protein